ncbi:hypothetical protein ACHAQA_007337 [Verticillium albo-atrum]
MRFSLQTAALAIACAPLTWALNATILADTDRDGSIDLATDAEGKAEWTEARGALFLPNIGDSNGRCSKEFAILEEGLDPEADWLDNIAVLNNFTNTCNDASGNVQRNPKYLAPLQTLPSCGLSESATGTIHVTDALAAENVRIFRKDGDEWTFVDANHTFTAKELKHGLSLGIDARDVRRAGAWDGTAVVHFTIADGAEKATDSVALRVAPVLTHHHAQAVSRAFVTAARWGGTAQPAFVADFERNAADAGIDDVYQFQYGDIWTQDFFEPGYASIPGPDGPVVIRILIRSAQSYREAGIEVFEKLRSDTVGAVQELVFGETIDSMGNLETIPPYTHDGKTYPAGRIIMGQWDGVEPLIFEFLKAQEAQAPLALDTAWLYVGHVDEFLQFLPSDNERGWIVMVDDPVAGLELLENASRDGHGAERAVSRPLLPGESPSLCIPHSTIDQVLQLPDFSSINKRASDRIDGNIAILKRETGITDDEIFRVPALFYPPERPAFQCRNSTSSGLGGVPDNTLSERLLKGGPSSKAQSIVEAARAPSASSLERRQTSFGEQLAALYPGTVNNAVLTDALVLVPNPWGPVIGGVDIFAEAVTAVYAEVSYNITYQDNWFSHHVGLGEIHCGSNTWRDTSTVWW